MKYSWLFAAAVLLAGCRKSGYNPPDVAPGCITRVTPRVTDLLVSPSAEDSALAALTAAHEPTNLLQVANTQLEPGTPPNGDTIYYVSCYLYLNGLPVRDAAASFSFIHGALYQSLSYEYLLNTNDTAGHQDLQYLRRVFLDYVSKWPAPFALPNLTDSCLTATLCYAPDYLFRKVSGGDHVLIKSWQVSYKWLSVYVRDDNGHPQLPPGPDILGTI